MDKAVAEKRPENSHIWDREEHEQMTEQFQPQDQGASSGTADMSETPVTKPAAVPFERKLTDALVVVEQPNGEVAIYRNNGLNKIVCYSHQTGSYRFHAIMQGMFDLGIAEQKRRTAAALRSITE